MSTHLCKENCLGSYTTECSLNMFYTCAFYLRKPPEMVTKDKEFLSRDLIQLIEKLRVISWKRLHVTVTDLEGNTFGSVDWQFSSTASWDSARNAYAQRFYFVKPREIDIGHVTNKQEQITFTCRDCLDKAIAEPLVPTLPPGVVAIVQGYL